MIVDYLITNKIPFLITLSFQRLLLSNEQQSEEYHLYIVAEHKNTTSTIVVEGSKFKRISPKSNIFMRSIKYIQFSRHLDKFKIIDKKMLGKIYDFNNFKESSGYKYQRHTFTPPFNDFLNHVNIKNRVIEILEEQDIEVLGAASFEDLFDFSQTTEGKKYWENKKAELIVFNIIRKRNMNTYNYRKRLKQKKQAK